MLPPSCKRFGGVDCDLDVLDVLVIMVSVDDGVVQSDQTTSAALVVERAHTVRFISAAAIQEVEMSIPGEVGPPTFPWDESHWCCRRNC